MASEVVNIPVRSIPDCFQSNRVEDLRLFLILKAKEGRFLPQQHNYCQKKLNRLCRIGWLTKHGDQYYQKKWVDVFPVDGKHTHAKIDSEVLEDPTYFKALLFLIGYAFLMSPQVPRKPKSRTDDATQVKNSRHNGGISHSICMKFFGFKKSWCSKMRKLCTKYGLAGWEDRIVPVQLQGSHKIVPLKVVDELMEGPGRYKITKNNQVVEQITSKFIQVVDPRLHIPYKYRPIVKEHYS